MLRRITKSEYETLEIPVLFIEREEKYNRCFAVIAGNGFSYKFVWHSDLIPPVITEVGHNVYGIGIDQHFVIVDFTKNAVVLNLDFYCYYYCTEIFNGFIWIATELLVIKVNKNTFEIVDEYGLPELFKEFIFEEDVITVKCLDDQIVVLG